MSAIRFLLIAWMIQAVVAALVVTPVVLLARKRVHWRSWELLSLIIPFWIWGTLFASELATGWKSLSNLAMEPALLGLALGGGALARAAMSRRVSQGRAAITTLVTMCIVAFGIFWSVPGLEE